METQRTGRMQWVLALSLAGLAVFASAEMARAHGTGAIFPSSKQIAVGSTFGLRGQELSKAGKVKLELRGTLDNFPLGTVTTDTGGRFTAQLALPSTVPPGSYTLVAIAADGDVEARTTLAIVASASASAGTAVASMPPDMPGMPGMKSAGSEAMSGGHATAEMMTIVHHNSPSEWLVIVLVVGAAFFGGAALLQRGRTHARETPQAPL